MTTEYEAQYEKSMKERRVIKEETRISMLLGLSILISIISMGVIAYLVKPEIKMSPKAMEDLIAIFNIVTVMLMVVMLAVRKTIYYSPRFIKDGFTLRQVLGKWRVIDLTLLSLNESIAIMGLIATLLGMPFNRTFHFFVGSTLLTVILMPMGIKVRSKLGILRERVDIVD